MRRAVILVAGALLFVCDVWDSATPIGTVRLEADEVNVAVRGELDWKGGIDTAAAE